MALNLHPQVVNVNSHKEFDITPKGCNNSSMSLSTRLIEAMEATGYTQPMLAKKVGMAQQSLSKLITGKSQGSKFLKKIEAVLGLPSGYLEYGKGNAVLGMAQPLIANCPLLSWKAALSWPDNKNEVIQNKLYENLASKIILDPDTYILQIKDDYMETHGEPDAPYFRKGSFIIIDPHKSYEHLDFVIAKNSAQKIFFRQYRIDDQGNENLYLLNERYPELSIQLTPEIKICGVMILHFTLPAKK